jgi:hypothetical protein
MLMFIGTKFILRTKAKQGYIFEGIKLMVKYILVPSPPPPGERGGGLSEAGCSAAAVNLPKRLSHYYSKKSMETYLKRGKSAIYSAILKHGLSLFKLEIIEYCEKKDTIKIEQYYLDLLKPEYNTLKVAGSSLGYKHDDEAKNKISDSQKKIDHSGRFKTGENNPNYGKLITVGSVKPSQKIEVFD